MIKTKPSNEAYRNGWDRAFSRPRPEYVQRVCFFCGCIRDYGKDESVPNVCPVHKDAIVHVRVLEKEAA